MGRFSDISRLKYEEIESITYTALDYFSPMGQNIKKENGVIVPHGVDEFYAYLCEKNAIYKNKIYKINKIIQKLEYGGVLTKMGQTRSVMFPGAYYCLKEVSSKQRETGLFLGEAFGLGYLKYKLGQNVVHITGRNSDNDVCNGSGFLIAKNAILTCKHVVEDMRIDPEVIIGGKEYSFEVKTHSDKCKDVALLILEKSVENHFLFPTFNTVDILDEVLVMGYPPIPFTKDAYMVALKGEVNAVVEDYSSIKHLVLSSTVRPGNSGGPVISQCGYLVGMVTQTTCNTNSTKDKQNKLNDDAETEKLMDKAPYYMALNGQELFESIKEIDGNIDIFFEDYQ